MKKIVYILLFIGIFFFAFLSLSVYSFSKIKTGSFELKKIEFISLSKLTFSGKIPVFNEGYLPIKIDKIDYEVKLDSSDEIISKGIIKGNLIRAKEVEEYEIENTMILSNSDSVVFDLLLNEQTNVTLNGIVTIFDYGFFKLKIPFEKKIDLGEFLLDYVKKNIKSYDENNLVEEVINKIDNVKKSIISMIS